MIISSVNLYMKTAKKFFYDADNLIKQYADVIFALIVFDLTLMPYNPFILMPFFLPVVVCIGVILSINVEKNFLFFAVVGLAMAIILISVIDKNERLGDIKRALQFISTFFYFITASVLAINVNRNIISKLCILVGAVFFVESVVFFAVGFDEFVVGVYGIDSLSPQRVANIEIAAPLEAYSRNSFMVSDPNTFAFICIVLGVLCMYFLGTSSLLFAFVCLSLSILSTKSGSGILCFGILAACTFFRVSSTIKPRIRYSLVAVILTGLTAGVFLFWLRLESTLEDPLGYITSGGLRFQIWGDIFSGNPPPIIGEGYHVSYKGELLFPHSDLVGFLYRYGILVTVSACAVFSMALARIDDWSMRLIFVLVCAVPFLLNSLVDHQRLFGLFLVALAVAGSRSGNSVESPETTPSHVK